MPVNRRNFLKLAGLGTLAAVVPKIAYSAQENENTSFAFVQVTDTHVPNKSGLLRSPKAVEAINNLSLPYDLIIHTGDVSHGHGDRVGMEKAREMLTFKKKTWFVPGNHDVTFDHSEKHEPAFEEVFGNPCYHAIVPRKGLRFVFFNSQPLSSRADAAVRETAYTKLEKTLTPKMPTILFCHATGLPDFYSNKMHGGWGKKTLDRWTAIMRKGGVFAVLAGHFHRDEYHRYNGIPFYIAPPVVGWWGRQTTFRHWKVENGLLSYRTIYV